MNLDSTPDENVGHLPSPDSLARRSVTSVAWKVAAQVVYLPIGLLQTILLARLLPVEYFGIAEGMAAVATISYTFFEFGLQGAFFHRSKETEDENLAASVYFTLRFISTFVWSAVLIIVSLTFLESMRQSALLIYAGVGFGNKVLDTPRLILMRRVQHKRLAIIGVTNSVLVFIASIFIAYVYGSIWALLISPVITLVWNIICLYVWHPFWFPRFVWDKEVIHYYLSFGSRNVIAYVMGMAIDRVDDLWTNIFLGDLALGFYSRAYKFATYPRVLLSSQVNVVALGTYAELKYDRKRLSQAFTRINTFLIRVAFLFGGWLVLIAQELIVLLLGERWLPMMVAFRLMLIFTLLDPIKITVGAVLVAVGEPEKLSLGRTIQFIVLIVFLFLLGIPFGIEGVALAVDFMMVIGMTLLMFFIRKHVDFSLRELFVRPFISMITGFALSLFIANITHLGNSDWWLMIIKSISFLCFYLLILFVLEGQFLIQTTRELFKSLPFFQQYRKTSE